MGFHRDDRGGFPKEGGGVLAESVRLLFGESEPLTPYLEETVFPTLDIYETAEEILVAAELPGVARENIDITFSNGTLVIEGIKKETIEGGRINFLCMERTFGTFRRIVPLMEPVDIPRITASYREGILEVRMPRLPERRGTRKTIPVSGG